MLDRLSTARLADAEARRLRHAPSATSVPPRRAESAHSPVRSAPRAFSYLGSVRCFRTSIRGPGRSHACTDALLARSGAPGIVVGASSPACTPTRTHRPGRSTPAAHGEQVAARPPQRPGSGASAGSGTRRAASARSRSRRSTSASSPPHAERRRQPGTLRGQARRTPARSPTTSPSPDGTKVVRPRPARRRPSRSTCPAERPHVHLLGPGPRRRRHEGRDHGRGRRPPAARPRRRPRRPARRRPTSQADPERPAVHALRPDRPDAPDGHDARHRPGRSRRS